MATLRVPLIALAGDRSGRRRVRGGCRRDAVRGGAGCAEPGAGGRWPARGHRHNRFTNTKNAYVTDADSKEPGTMLTDPSPSPSWPYSFTLDATSSVTGIVSAQAGPN